ncbi:MAG: anaerobic carbon-monoxide dehydrogenase catalytic subunit [Armatimonadetes bacterium]|nr:anaerobic carbon-monoxide dehydrogenase catalytic subunit [Armatimonadota bacterium]
MGKREAPERPSLHASVNTVYEGMKEGEATNVYDRYVDMDGRCPFCEAGLRCSICSNGPCQIRPRQGVLKGVCGIDANGMVVRNFVHLDIMGLSAYTHHTREVARTLKAVGAGEAPYEIRDVAKLDLLAAALGVGEIEDIKARAAAVGDAILASLDDASGAESKMALAFAPQERIGVWRSLGIMPRNPLYELVSASTRTMTNIDGDWLSLARTVLRLGLASCYGALVPLELGQDALFGTPMPHTAKVDLGILDPDYVNILPNGHEPFVGFRLIELARSERAQQMAREAGAKGLRIIGSSETGQELMQRAETDDVFVGCIGNWIMQEYAIATGAVDVFAMDMNCSVPTLGELAEKYGTTLVAVGEVIGVPGTHHRLEYEPGKVDEQAWQIIEWAVENFKRRKDKPAVRDLPSREIVTGFSTEACLQALGGSLQPLLEVIAQGSIQGIAALISCTTLTNGPQDSLTAAVARELIKRDILVLSAGCGNGACQVAGLNSMEAIEDAGEGLAAVCRQLGIPPVLSFGTCTDTGRLVLLVTAVADALGCNIPDLPVAVTAPEYMEQKATVDASAALALGLYTHVSPVPPVTGSPDFVKLVTEDLEGMTGGKLALGEDPVAVADGILEHIKAKRAGLGI